MKADLDGNLLWQTTYDSTGSDIINVVIADGGRYVMAGYYDPFEFSGNAGSYAYLLATGPGGSSSSSTVSGSGPDCCCICPLVLLILLAVVAAAGYLYWKKGGKIDGLQGLMTPGQADEILGRIKQTKK
jgi:hypothetical protein